MVGCTNGFGHGHLDAHLLAELEHDGRAAVVLDDFLFAAVPARARQRHAGHADAKQRFLDGGESFGANDGDDELHGLLRADPVLEWRTIGEK